MRQNLKGQDILSEEKKETFQGFRVFDFDLYSKLKTRNSRKVFSYFKL